MTVSGLSNLVAADLSDTQLSAAKSAGNPQVLLETILALPAESSDRKPQGGSTPKSLKTFV